MQSASIQIKECIGFVQIFDLAFWGKLRVLGCSEHDLTISVCVTKIFGKCSSRSNPQNFMEFFIECYPNINGCLSTSDEKLSTGGAVISFLPKFSGSRFLVYEMAQKFIYKMYVFRNNNDAMSYLSKGRCYSDFPKILVLDLSPIP